MSKSTAPLFGRLLRECRKRAGLNQRALPSTQAPQDAPPTSEKAQEHSSESFTDADEDASMRVLYSEKRADSVQIWMKPEGNPLSQGKEGERQPSSEPEQRQQAPKKGDVYKRKSRTHYDTEYLRGNAGNFVGLLVDAVENQDPVLSPMAEQVLQSLHIFAENVAKTKGSSLSQVSREHGIPIKSLSEWVRKGLIPVLYRDRNTIYLPKDTAQETARIYHESKEHGLQTAPFLKEMHDSLFSVSSTNRT